MTLRRQLILTMVAAAMAAAPAAAGAASGGAAPGTITLPGDPPTVVRVGNPLLTAQAGDLAIAVRASAHVRGRVRVDGRAPAGAGGRVLVERLDAARGWLVVARAAVGEDGTFRATWRPRRAGSFQLRAVLEAQGAGERNAATSAGLAGPQVEVAVYERGVASWYGPGLWGVETACGVTLRPETIGVAHRTLPCGALVVLYHRGRTLVAPVIDRGPFLAGRTWDLTLATFEGLGGGAEDGLLTLGALAQPVG